MVLKIIRQMIPFWFLFLLLFVCGCVCGWVESASVKDTKPWRSGSLPLQDILYIILYVIYYILYIIYHISYIIYFIFITISHTKPWEEQGACLPLQEVQKCEKFDKKDPHPEKHRSRNIKHHICYVLLLCPNVINIGTVMDPDLMWLWIRSRNAPLTGVQ